MASLSIGQFSLLGINSIVTYAAAFLLVSGCSKDESADEVRLSTKFILLNGAEKASFSPGEAVEGNLLVKNDSKRKISNLQLKSTGVGCLGVFDNSFTLTNLSPEENNVKLDKPILIKIDPQCQPGELAQLKLDGSYELGGQTFKLAESLPMTINAEINHPQVTVQDFYLGENPKQKSIIKGDLFKINVQLKNTGLEATNKLDLKWGLKNGQRFTLKSPESKVKDLKVDETSTYTYEGEVIEGEDDFVFFKLVWKTSTGHTGAEILTVPIEPGLIVGDVKLVESGRSVEIGKRELNLNLKVVNDSQQEFGFGQIEVEGVEGPASIYKEFHTANFRNLQPRSKAAITGGDLRLVVDNAEIKEAIIIHLKWSTSRGRSGQVTIRIEPAEIPLPGHTL